MKKYKLHKNYATRFFRKVALSMITCCILSGLLFFVSCTPLDNSPEASDVDGNSISSTKEETTETEENNNENHPASEEAIENESGDIAIKVYYADDMAQYLVGEARTVSVENKYVDALYELMKLPVDSSLHRLIPESTKINSVTVENGLAKVDLSKEFVEDRFRSDTTDILLIYSIVNTLTEFPEINSVSFYIDGEKLDILGELAIDEPIFRRSDLIKE